MFLCIKKHSSLRTFKRLKRLKRLKPLNAGLRKLTVILLLLLNKTISAQTLGGTTVFNFLKVPNTPQLSALGGINVSQVSNDVGLAFNNPALLKPQMHSQMNAVFNDFYAGITSYHLSLGYYHQRLHTSFLWGLNYFN